MDSEALKKTVMADGSIPFGEVPSHLHSEGLKRHLERVPGVRVTALLADVVEAWIDFEYAGRKFSAHDTFGSYWLYAEANDPHDVLFEVLRLCKDPEAAVLPPPSRASEPHRVSSSSILFVAGAVFFVLALLVFRGGAQLVSGLIGTLFLLLGLSARGREQRG